MVNKNLLLFLRELGDSQDFRPKQSQMERCKQSPFLLEKGLHLSHEEMMSSPDWNNFHAEELVVLDHFPMSQVFVTQAS